mgnify:FL=1
MPSYKYIDLYKIWHEKIRENPKTKCHYVQTTVLSQLDVRKFSEENIKQVRKALYNLCVEILKRWKRSNRTEKRFLQKNAEWLNKVFHFPLEYFEKVPSIEEDLPTTSGLVPPQKAI